MPKAIPDTPSADAYEEAISQNKAQLTEILGESKPLVDFCALMTTNVAITSLFFILLNKILHS
jgi:hypothetical protein